MDNLFFQDKNQIYNIIISKTAYEKMLLYCERANPYETGGILIGNYSLNQATANILQVTEPPKNSKHARCNFHRSSCGLKKLLDAAWDQDQFYLGEWHYHSNASTNPSCTDISQMITLAHNSKLKCPEPILIIVGGHSNNWELFISVFSNKRDTTLKQLK